MWYTLHTRFCTLGANLHAQSVTIDKISALELSRKFIKGALLVGRLSVPSPTPFPFTMTFRAEEELCKDGRTGARRVV